MSWRIIGAGAPRAGVYARAAEPGIHPAAFNGYAISGGEWRDSVGGVVAPVFDAFSAPAAAIGISGPPKRLGVKRMNELACRRCGKRR
jgi:DNA-binding IclR family transcriptional regulator